MVTVAVEVKGGGRETKEEWDWEGKRIQTTKEFKYLGYTSQRNNGKSSHIRDITKRANIVMAQISELGERKFPSNWKLRLTQFDYTVKSIVMYASEIWGWKEQDPIEKAQYKYLRWILGLDRQTPRYILMEEIKREKSNRI
ncbi:hypothetical protein CBL_20106 [Carabus blaptoides fortunei]